MKIKYIVKPNDSLWKLAKKYLGDPDRWIEIWHENDQVENPDVIYPGDVLMIDITNEEHWYSHWISTNEQSTVQPQN
jgi:LysM repeat protein